MYVVIVFLLVGRVGSSRRRSRPTRPVWAARPTGDSPVRTRPVVARQTQLKFLVFSCYPETRQKRPFRGSRAPRAIILVCKFAEKSPYEEYEIG